MILLIFHLKYKINYNYFLLVIINLFMNINKFIIVEYLFQLNILVNIYYYVTITK
nr:hypothetical protein [Megavirus caiporensis]